MKIIFCDINKNNLDALKSEFQQIPNFEFVDKSINSVDADCIVSPANSYGIMDGGVDRIINYSLNYISEKVQNQIQIKYGGEQPVGTCMIVPVDKSALTQGRYKYLAHTPTMRIPKDVSKSDNSYLAFRALLLEILQHNEKYKDIKSVVVTSFCCGAGKMDPVVSARQMKLAYNCVINNTPCTWKIANMIDNTLENIKM
jgi:O-acetyl-ADP-ribose deacetylase (regulator of RNase III)